MIDKECHGAVTKCPGCGCLEYDNLYWCRDCGEYVETIKCPDCNASPVTLCRCKECGHVYE
jgi:hypothetical protein